MDKHLFLLYKFLISNNLFKEANSLNFIIKEAASKLNALKKIGFSEEVAKKINDICKGLSMWLSGKLIESIISRGLVEKTGDAKKTAIEYINNNIQSLYLDLANLEYIVEWLRVGVDGNLDEYKNLSYEDLSNKAKEWSDTFDLDSGDINYTEDNDIILDFRDKDGLGFYWTNLRTYKSDEEADRMGHCGTTVFGNTLFSLRKFVKIGKNHTLNKSVLTAAVDPNGNLVQLKGAKNSKPLEEYNKYIVPFLKIKNEETGKSLITGIKYDYDPRNDFNLMDLDKDTLLNVYNENKDLFKNINTKIYLAGKTKDFSVLKDVNINYILSDDDFVYLIWLSSDMFRDEKSLFKTISSHDIEFNHYDYIEKSDIIDIFDEINDENKQKIINTVMKALGSTGATLSNFESYFKENYGELIDSDITHALHSAMANYMSDLSAEYIRETVINGLKQNFKNVYLDDDLVLNVTVNLKDFLSKLNPSSLDSALKIANEIIFSKEDSFEEEFISSCIKEGLFGSARISLYDINLLRNKSSELLNEYISFNI